MYKSKYKKVNFGSKRRLKPKYKKVNKVNPGYSIRRDNMVYMKQLHRGPGRMKNNYGNPESDYPMNLRGLYKYTRDKRVKRGKFLRGSVRSDL